MNRAVNTKGSDGGRDEHRGVTQKVRKANGGCGGTNRDLLQSQAEGLERRARNHYNRDYARQSDSNPNHKHEKRGIRRSLRPGTRPPGIRVNDPRQRKEDGRVLCGFCGRRPAVCVVNRFGISEKTASGFQAIRVLYCGLC